MSHPDKTAFVIMGPETFKDDVRKTIRSVPLTFGNFEVKEKEFDKYLGDCLSSNGLSDSVDRTIKGREGTTKTAIMEVASLVNDLRMQAVGGILSGFDLWNLCIIPSLLNNCSTWTDISVKSLERLEELQNLFVRVLLRVPITTPKVALLSETGLLSMKHRIWQEKILLVMAILKMKKEVLSRRVLKEQLENNYPGLGQEVRRICEELSIPNVTKSMVQKQMLKRAILIHHCKEIKENMLTYKKLKNLVNEDNIKTKEYMKTMTVSNVRSNFRIRTNMLELIGNMKGGHIDIRCRACKKSGSKEDQSHVQNCQEYQDLKEGLDMFRDFDLIKFFRNVIIRMTQNK